MAIGAEQGRIKAGDHVAMLGIGSGINCQMLAVDWQKSPTEKQRRIDGPHTAVLDPKSSTAQAAAQ